MTQGGTYYQTSESVSEGHPDKVCDRISDEIVDLYLREAEKSGVDPGTVRVACETLATTNSVVLAGETRGPRLITRDWIAHVVRMAVWDIGYEQEGFHWEKLDVTVMLHYQSADIAQGVDSSGSREEGAGDQGTMFGYACVETPDFMPAPIYYAHKILRLIAVARRTSAAGMLGPDGKSQLTIRYENGKPVGVSQIVISHQHIDEDLSSRQVREIIEPYVRKALPDGWIGKDTIWHVNPTGKFFIGGPDGDCGLTGRKIVVDAYGASVPHGGGAFSGKDPSKMDRSGSYAARYLAKNIVAAGIAERCGIQLSYAIGVARPISIHVDTFGTSQIDDRKLERALSEVMDLTPRGIRNHLGLNKPIYGRTAAYGHFGRKPEDDGGFSWEKTDLANHIRSLLIT